VIDAYASLRPGDTREIVVDGHTIHVTATRHGHEGTRYYSVECVSCRVTISPATGIVAHHIERHTTRKKP